MLQNGCGELLRPFCLRVQHFALIKVRPQHVLRTHCPKFSNAAVALMQIRARFGTILHMLCKTAFDDLALRPFAIRRTKRIDQMNIIAKSITIATALALGGCTYNKTEPAVPISGAVLGGITGAALGKIIGDDTGSAIIGGVIGAAVGGAIAQNMANQEAELNQSLAGSGARIVNTGSQLRVILPENVTFATGSAVVNSAFRPELATVARSLRNFPDSTVRILGHTDNVGTDAINTQLSWDRANAVSRILVSNGVSNTRITYSGRGAAEPITSNATAVGRAQNRRVEIVITPTN
jgi:outer membrane protein OmpA-like peptidoglycan-associated protein